MINRAQYLNKLINWKDKPIIKVITGVRRCGKSSLLLLFKDYLIDTQINDKHIIYMNFESMLFDEINDYRDLYGKITASISSTAEKHYILLDEIQLIDQWEKCVNGLMVDYDVDIYITGSNSYLLSSELSTLIAGRFVEIKMLPLSFKEYLDFTETEIINNRPELEYRFDEFIKYGGFPSLIVYGNQEEFAEDFLTGIYNTVVMKDIIQRNQVRHPALLENLIRFLAANVGSIVSTRKISNYLTSSGTKTSSDTIDNYLRMIESSFIIYKASRYDLKGKLFLKTLEKYYIVDSGIRNMLAGPRNIDEGHVLENIIYLELIRRGYQVSIGKLGDLEVDFVAVKQSEKIYVQVSLTIHDESTRDREIKPLKAIRDNYPKFIITMDKVIFDDFDGIKIVNAIDFLLNN
jgi:predicted AAA+ superfamily ATPase